MQISIYDKLYIQCNNFIIIMLYNILDLIVYTYKHNLYNYIYV